MDTDNYDTMTPIWRVKIFAICLSNFYFKCPKGFELVKNVNFRASLSLSFSYGNSLQLHLSILKKNNEIE